MINRLALGVVVATAVSTLSWVVAAEHTKDTLSTVKKNVEEKKAILVDVREKSEWDAGHIEGAVFLPLSELKGSAVDKRLAKQLGKDKIIYTHCAVGKRAITAANILHDLGYNVRPLKPGYQELIKAEFKKAKDDR